MFLIKEFTAKIGLLKLVRKFEDDCADELTVDPVTLRFSVTSALLHSQKTPHSISAVDSNPVMTAILEKDTLASQPTISRFWNRMDEDTLVYSLFYWFRRLALSANMRKQRINNIRKYLKLPISASLLLPTPLS